MKLSTRIVQSRHGVYYYRHQFTEAGKRREKRFSLNTKNPATAKQKSLLVSAMLIANRSGIAMAHDDVNIKQVLDKIGNDARNLEVVFENGTLRMKADPNVPGDVEALLKVGKDFLSSELGQSFKHVLTPQAAPVVPSSEVAQQPSIAAAPVPIQAPVAQPAIATGGMTIEESIKRYATRQGPKLAPSTFYEYGNYHRIFKDWMNKRHKREFIPIREATRQDLSAFIDDLLAEGLAHKTIKEKYLAAISGLFVLARSEGSFPDNITLPSHGHNLLTKREAKKVQDKTSRKPFTEEDLKSIFNPETFLAQKNPTDYWLPLLGLFTGGRINELCQLMATTDIKKIGDIWSISINDEEESQRLKSSAARRVIPIHPTLIKLGFLDFVEDMKPFGGMLFPYLTQDTKKQNFSGTPSERFGNYLDTLGITDKRKVFHSFRSTSNNRLKQQGVAEETRCQFIGHEHDTVNSTVYSEDHNVAYLLEHAASKLSFDVNFDKIPYPRDLIVKATKQKVLIKQRRENHKKVAEERANSK